MKLKSILANLALMAGSLLVCFLVFEFIIFKYILKTSDAIPNTSINNIIRYVPGSQATLYERDGTSHTVSINANGWNSSHTKYNKEKPKDTLRIAVIGDSYVQASAVNVKEGFAEVIEQNLNAKGQNSQIYRFGIDGAPLSQYLYMARNEALQFKPDIMVVQLIHNDFDESYRFLYGRYSSSFMKLKLGATTIEEVAPAPYQPGLIDSLKKSRTFRYLYYQTGLSTIMRRVINTKDDKVDEAEKQQAPKHGFVQSAIDVRNITELDKIRTVTSYSFAKLKALSQTHNAKLLLVMDPVREAIYSGDDAQNYEANALNIIAKQEAKKQNIPFLDLKEAMTTHYKTHKQKFEFPWDWHWNKLGNKTAGQAIANKIHEQFLTNQQ